MILTAGWAREKLSFNPNPICLDNENIYIYIYLHRHDFSSLLVIFSNQNTTSKKE